MCFCMVLHNQFHALQGSVAHPGRRKLPISLSCPRQKRESKLPGAEESQGSMLHLVRHKSKLTNFTMLAAKHVEMRATPLITRGAIAEQIGSRPESHARLD